MWNSDKGVASLVNSVYGFIDLYKEVPGDHTFDLIDDLNIKSEEKEHLDSLVEYCASTYDSINIPYIFGLMNRFHRQAILKDAIRECAGRIDKGEIDYVEDVLRTALKKELVSFNPGSTLSDVLDRMRQQDDNNRDHIKLGIPALDVRLIHPRRKELFALAAPAKGSKSWGLIYTGVMGIIGGFKVAHVSLEMSEDVVGQRYLQSCFAVTKRQCTITQPPAFDGNHGVKWAQGVGANGCLQNDNTLDDLERKVKHAMFDNLRIKEFPTSSLSINGLKGYLDSLEQTGFTPDLLIIDYADLMKLGNTKEADQRIEIGKIYKEIRGLAVERNIMVATASQINRAGASSKKIDATHISEDYSKIGTVDTLLIIQATPEQKEAGFAVLHVAAARNDESGFDVYISQKLAAGQWCMTSSDKLTPDFVDKVSSFVGITIP